MHANIQLRNIKEDDLEILFEHQADEAASYMAAFTKEDPNNWQAFKEHWERTLKLGSTFIQVITIDKKVVGYVCSFLLFEKETIGYWIDKNYWGKGIASCSLKLFLDKIETRPVFARVAFDNLGSIRVLEKCGFAKIGEDNFHANARGKEIKEFIYCLS